MSRGGRRTGTRASGGSDGGAPAEKPDKAKEKATAGESVRSLGIAVILFLVLRTFVLQAFFITSGSMEDTLLVGDFLMVNRAAVGAHIPFTQIRVPGYSGLERGDILVFTRAGMQNENHDPDLKLVKRLMGLPGDTLEMEAGVLMVNGRALDEPYVKETGASDSQDAEMLWQARYLAPGVDATTYRPTRDTWGPIVIPEDRYFMLGDNRHSSLDSRYWGLLERWRFEGRVSFIYFSYNRGSYEPFPWLREIRWGRLFNGVD